MFQMVQNSILECTKPAMFGQMNSHLANYINNISTSKPKQFTLRIFNANLALSQEGFFKANPNKINPRSLDLEENWARRGLVPAEAAIEDIVNPDKPLYLTIPHYGGIYGHWIADVLPDLAMAKYLLPNMTINLVHLPHCPEFGKRLASQFGISASNFVNISSLDPNAIYQVLSITPSREHDYFHASLLKRAYVRQLRSFDVASDAGAHDETENGDLVYVSRRAWKELLPDTRSMSNRDEIEDLFKSHGFQIIYPETLTIAQQRSIFYRSKIVAGESGSGLHNSAFMKSGTQILCLQSGRQTHIIQSSLCGLFDQSCDYVIGSHENAEWHSNFEICPQAANEAIELAKKKLLNRNAQAPNSPLTN